MLHKVSTVGVVNLTNAIGHPIDILMRLSKALRSRSWNTNAITETGFISCFAEPEEADEFKAGKFELLEPLIANSY